MKAISCEFNIDTACVETLFGDGKRLCIYTPGVDATLDITMKQQSEVDWLVYNDPVAYTNLVLSGELEEYAKAVSGTHTLID